MSAVRLTRRAAPAGGLRAAIAAFTGSDPAPREVSIACETVALRLAAEGWARPVAAVRPSEPIDAAAERIARALTSGEPLGRRDLRQAPWCLWAGARPLADIPGAVARLIEAIDRAGRPRLVTSLAAALLDTFDAARPGTAEVAAFLAANLAQLGPPWDRAARDLAIFSLDEGPKRVAQAALDRGTVPEAIVEAAGIGRPLGLVVAAHRAGFARLAATAVGDGPRIVGTVTRWAFEDGRVRHESLRQAAAEAAVEPFGRGVPDGAVRGAALDLALRLLGDPRGAESRWTGASRAEAIVRRWLDGVALTSFFTERSGGGEEDPWLHRRAFWTALWERGHIDAMRIVTADDGASSAEPMGAGAVPARFAAGTVAPGHTALLMRVGTLTIADWSHGAPCFIWDGERGEGGPDLTCDVFQPDALRKVLSGDNTEANSAKQGRFLHRGSAAYRWQGLVADYLRGRRGIILERQDYEVRG